MKGGFQPWRISFRQLCGSAAWCISSARNVMSAIPKRDQQEVATKLSGIFKQEKREEALLNLAASTRQIPEALSRGRWQPLRRRRALPHVLCLPAGHASLHSQYQCH